MPYGAFVEFLPGKDGLLHISEIDWKRLETIEEAGLKEGDDIEVKLLDIDSKTGNSNCHIRSYYLNQKEWEKVTTQNANVSLNKIKNRNNKHSL